MRNIELAKKDSHSTINSEANSNSDVDWMCVVCAGRWICAVAEKTGFFARIVRLGVMTNVVHSMLKSVSTPQIFASKASLISEKRSDQTKIYLV